MINNFNMEIVFELPDIHSAAAELWSHINDQKVLAFHGAMGAGKTTFIHALCEYLQVIDTISSPTFSIINEYKTRQGQTIYHMDLYRLKNEDEAITAGVEDCLFSGNICLVEWPEKAPGIFPDDTLQITIHAINTNLRKLKINL